MVLTMRVRPELYESLKAEAEREGRSIAAQAEQRLLREAPNEVAVLVGRVVDAVQQQTGKSFRDDNDTKKKCRSAAELILNVMLGPTLQTDVILAAITNEMERARAVVEGRATPTLDTFLGLDPPSFSRADAMLKELQEWIDAQKIADDAAKSFFGEP